MCMMCEQEEMYQAYLDWLAKKEAEEAAAAKAADAKPSDDKPVDDKPAIATSSPKPASAAQPASGFICDGPAEE
jgi:hypothetical protein